MGDYAKQFLKGQLQPDFAIIRFDGKIQSTADTLRIAIYHTELSRDGPGLLLRDILSGDDPQVLAVSNVIRAANADVLILSGIDYDLQRHALNAFAGHLQEYDHLVARAPNRGLPTSMDVICRLEGGKCAFPSSIGASTRGCRTRTRWCSGLSAKCG